MTKTFDVCMSSCQPKSNFFDPTYFSYAIFPMKHTTLGFCVLIILSIFLLPGSSSPFFREVTSGVGLSIIFIKPNPYT